jgi:hypothetical protein
VLSFTARCKARLTRSVTGYDGGDGVEARSSTKRNNYPRTTLSPFIVTDAVQPRHPRHEREKNNKERPQGRGLRDRDGVRDETVSRVRNFVTTRHLPLLGGA